jgi:hypothetical protein
MHARRVLRFFGLLLQIAGVTIGGLSALLTFAIIAHEDHPPYDVLEGGRAVAVAGMFGILLGLVSGLCGWGLRRWSKPKV